MRSHFHSFLSDVHARLHEVRKQDLRERGRSHERYDAARPRLGSLSVDPTYLSLPDEDPVSRVAADLASGISLLCLDEFQVTDVADALILRRLFSVLWGRGVVTVATGNAHPDGLYEGGINRSYFLPFVDALKRHCLVYDIATGVASVEMGELGSATTTATSTDYRRLMASSSTKDGESSFFAGDGADRKCDRLFRSVLDLASSDTNDTTMTNRADPPRPVSLDLPVAFNRTLTSRESCPSFSVARFGFAELCDAELGPDDYRSVASAFRSVVITGLPPGGLSPTDPDRARRFVTLIDELYEGGCALALMCDEEMNPDELFRGVGGTATTSREEIGTTTKPGEAFGIDVPTPSGGNLGRRQTLPGESASVRELSYAFRRASSRIAEMCSGGKWDVVRRGIREEAMK